MGARNGSTRRQDEAALHEIRVQGHLDDRWADWAEALTLTRESDGTTTLQGSIADQAALHGLLNRIRDLNVPIVSVRRVGPDGKRHATKVCIVGASGKLGQYMVRHALDRGYEVTGVCREQSVAKLDAFAGRITVIPGATDDREVIGKAAAGCGGVLTVLVPRGVHGYSAGTAQAVLDLAAPGARMVFSCGWHHP
jgi:hypothetical protein